MQPSPVVDQRRSLAGAHVIGVALALSVLLGFCTAAATAQGVVATPGPTVHAPVPALAHGRAPAAAEEGMRWQKLKPTQREALKPLQQEWSGMDSPSRQKWLQLSERLPSMPADERDRVQARMSDWEKLTPAERGQARLRFQEAKQTPLPDRRSRWAAYEALPPEQKRALAARAGAAPSPNPADGGARRATAASGRSDRADRAGHDAPRAKSNIVPNPAFAPPPRPIGPTVMQATPGATTTLITRRPAPPPHQQTGLPKIAATPEFVNRSTLLPQRGPQGAAVRQAAPPQPASAGGR